MATLATRMKGGIANPNFRTGLYSKRLPVRYAATIQALSDDANLLSFREDIAALSARWLEVAEQMDTGESGRAWEDMREAWNDLKTALQTGDIVAINRLVGEIDGLIRSGQGVYRAWAELERLSLTIAQLKRAEQQRLAMHQATMTADQAAALIMAIGISVRRHVKEPKILELIQRDIETAMAGGYRAG